MIKAVKFFGMKKKITYTYLLFTILQHDVT